MDLISIIIPCYNYAHLLDKTLDSIINQTHQNWEIIAVNDGSEDNTEKLLRDYQLKDNRIKSYNIKNAGPSNARNVGLDNASGDFFMFLDSDDLIPPRKLEAHINHFKEQKDLDISYTDGLYFDHDYPNIYYRRGSLKNKPWIPVINNQKGYKVIEHLITRNIMPICSPLFRKRIVDIVGFLNIKYYYMEDWEYFIRCAFSNLTFDYLEGREFAVLIRVQKRSLSKNTKKMALHEATIRNNFDHNIEKWSNKLNLESNQIFTLRKINKIEMYRAYLRSGDFKYYYKMLIENLDISFSKKVSFCVLDFFRFVKYRLKF